jgi:hypothetical protein
MIKGNKRNDRWLVVMTPTTKGIITETTNEALRGYTLNYVYVNNERAIYYTDDKTKLTDELFVEMKDKLKDCLLNRKRDVEYEISTYTKELNILNGVLNPLMREEKLERILND